jgi:acyl-CoA synthetase (AMP-forming)/AMP-acid ligase II
MLFTDYVGAANDHTAAIRDGDWLSVRDMGYFDAQGFLCLIGRENRMLVTQGKNLFPEEVEATLMRHPGIAHASVQGVPDPIRGQHVVALLHTTTPDITAQQLTDFSRTQLESYKIPKRFMACNTWPLTASGKTDHPALAQLLNQHVQNKPSSPCLHTIH